MKRTLKSCLLFIATFEDNKEFAPVLFLANTAPLHPQHYNFINFTKFCYVGENMLLVTNLVIQLNKTFELINKWNLLPLCLPYSIHKCTIKSTGNKIKTKYVFQVNPKFIHEGDWKPQFFLLSLVSVVGTYKLFCEQDTRLTTCMDSFSIFGFSCVIGTVYGHFCHGALFAKLFNEILKFEGRHVRGNTREGKYLLLSKSLCRTLNHFFKA